MLGIEGEGAGRLRGECRRRVLTARARLRDTLGSFSFSFRMALASLALALGACATVFEAGRPTLTITSDPSGAATIEQGSDTRLGNTPAYLHLRPVAISVRLERPPCDTESLQFGRAFNKTSLWNLINPIGWIVDAASGHIWRFQPADAHPVLNCRLRPRPVPPPEFSPVRGLLVPDVLEQLPPPASIVSPSLSGAEFSDLYTALADLAESVGCPGAIPGYWRMLAEQTASQGRGKERHFARETLAQAIALEMGDLRERLAGICAQHSEMVSQCTALLTNPPIARVKSSEFVGSVLFGFDKAKIKRRATRERLRRLALALKPVAPALHVVLTGYTDPIGSDSYNHRLGCRRAQAVQAVLAEEGLTPELIVVRSRGRDPVHQVAPGKGGSRKGAELNRRVSVEVVPFDAGVSDEESCSDRGRGNV
jgi:outer membrane protein OmpA-like peptidoglycan-associated protein